MPLPFSLRISSNRMPYVCEDTILSNLLSARQSTARRWTLGPKQALNEWLRKGIQAPRPPMSRDLMGWLPGTREVPSNSSGSETFSFPSESQCVVRTADKELE